MIISNLTSKTQAISILMCDRTTEALSKDGKEFWTKLVEGWALKNDK